MLQTPNAASVALIHGDDILLIQRARAPWLGLWSFPGGRLEPGETAEACAIREIGEELGVAIADLRPVTRLHLGDGKFLLQVYATTAFTGEITISDEIAAYRWVPGNQLGGLETTPHLAEVIQAAFQLFDHS